jgi:hypothetical protein
MCGRASPALIRVLINHGSNVYTKNGRTLKDSCAKGSEVQAVVKEEINNRRKCAVFAMALHERVGVGSKPGVFDLEIIRMIISAV